MVGQAATGPPTIGEELSMGKHYRACRRHRKFA